MTRKNSKNETANTHPSNAMLTAAFALRVGGAMTIPLRSAAISSSYFLSVPDSWVYVSVEHVHDECCCDI